MDLLIYLAVVLVVWAGVAVFRHRRRAGRPSLGDADAYEGNLVIPPPGSAATQHRAHSSHGGHVPGHGGAQAGHGGHIGGHGGLSGHSGGFSGHH